MAELPLADNVVAMRLDTADMALFDLLRQLQRRDYRFVTPTPATHGRIVARPGRGRATSLIDIFGWSLPFAQDLLPAELLSCLGAGGMLAPAAGGLWRSTVRVSSLHDDLYLHSAYPTEDADSVFFGPDSYRFADLIVRELARCPEREGARIADIGSGAGVGAVVAAKACPRAQVIATDVNPKALRLARINAAAAGVTIDPVETSGLDGVDPPLDVVMLNPPYIIDEAGRTYRNGGGMHGGALSLNLTIGAMDRLASGGRVILYTGSAILNGDDPLRSSIAAEADRRGFRLHYHEIDPDVFGEELANPHYQDVDRIALISAIVERP